MKYRSGLFYFIKDIEVDYYNGEKDIISKEESIELDINDKIIYIKAFNKSIFVNGKYIPVESIDKLNDYISLAISMTKDPSSLKIKRTDDEIGKRIFTSFKVNVCIGINGAGSINNGSNVEIGYKGLLFDKHCAGIVCIHDNAVRNETLRIFEKSGKIKQIKMKDIFFINEIPSVKVIQGPPGPQGPRGPMGNCGMRGEDGTKIHSYSSFGNIDIKDYFNKDDLLFIYGFNSKYTGYIYKCVKDGYYPKAEFEKIFEL